jgi:surface-anchored protein
LGRITRGALRLAHAILARGNQFKAVNLCALAAAGALALAGSSRAADLPVLTTGHTDVGVNYEDDAWDLHVHAEALGLEYEPDGVWLKVMPTARTTVPSAPAYGFLGAAGSSIWVLPAIQRPDLLFLGFGTEELASGIFANNAVTLALKSVEGPGHFIVYQVDAFGSPIVFYNSRDGLDTNDVRTLLGGGHTHVNWAFTTPGKYRIGFQATGVLAATGETTTSDVAEYLFDVGELPRLALAKEAGHDHLHLEWLSETNARYQIQCRMEASGGSWTNLGSPIAGNGGLMEEHIEPEKARQFFRVLVDYSGGSEPGIVARLFIADATNAVLSMIDLETGVVSPGLFPLTSRAVLGSTPSSRYCLAVELDADKAELFDSGIYVEDHGDHWHYYKENPRRMNISLLGDNPVHTVTVGDWLTLHWDLTGRVDFFNEPELEVLSDSYVPRTIAAGAQHGSSVPFTNAGRFFAISKPNPLYPVPVPNPLPVGVDIWDLDTSNRVHTATGYSNMHGEAGNGWSAAFGFTQGVLVLWHNGTGWTNYMVTNPPAMPTGYRIGDLRGHESLNHFFGLAFVGETAGDMFVINATNLTMELLPLPGNSFAVAYELSPDGNAFNVVLANGDFVQLNARTLQVIGTRTGLIAPSTDHSNHGQFHPGVAVGLGRICVTDPAGQRVLELDASTLQTLRTFPLSGTPTKVSMHGVLVPPTRP